MIKCDICGDERASTSWRPERVPVKLCEDVEVTILPTVPVITCPACGETYTDERGADIREEAVKTLRVAYEAGWLQGAMRAAGEIET
jgi:YgiT-type zinc finger domain-containing protein